MAGCILYMNYGKDSKHAIKILNDNGVEFHRKIFPNYKGGETLPKLITPVGIQNGIFEIESYAKAKSALDIHYDLDW